MTYGRQTAGSTLDGVAAALLLLIVGRPLRVEVEVAVMLGGDRVGDGPVTVEKDGLVRVDIEIVLTGNLLVDVVALIETEMENDGRVDDPVAVELVLK